MRVIDNVKLPGFVQWCSNFVKRVILPTQLHIDGKKVDTVEIVDIDEKRIYLSICGVSFIIRTWNYFPCEQDGNGMTCGEKVEYTLFLVEEYTMPNGWVSGNGRPMSSGILKIKWTNDPLIRQKEIETYNKLHGAE